MIGTHKPRKTRKKHLSKTNYGSVEEYDPEYHGIMENIGNININDAHINGINLNQLLG